MSFGGLHLQERIVLRRRIVQPTDGIAWRERQMLPMAPG